MITKTAKSSNTGHSDRQSGSIPLPLYRTGVSNTPLDSHLKSPLTTLKDYIRFTFKLETREALDTIIKTTFQALKDIPLYEEGKGRMNGKYYHNSGKGVKGAVFLWNNPGEESSHVLGNALVSIPASALAGLTQRQIWELLCKLKREYKVKFTRVDVAIDDMTKSLTFDLVKEALESKNYAGFREGKIIKTETKDGKNKGFTIYLGSRNSDCVVRLYDKDAESGGVINAYRLEGEFKNKLAEDLVDKYITINPDSYDSLAASFLAGCVIARIDFTEPKSKAGHKNRDRRKRLPWWQSFVDRVGATVKLSIQRVDPTLQATVGWIKRSVAPTLAVLRRTLGVLDFRAFLDNLIDEKDKTLSSENEAKAQVWSSLKNQVDRPTLRKGFAPSKTVVEKVPQQHVYEAPPSVFLPGTYVEHQLTGIIRKVLHCTHTHAQLEGEEKAYSVHVLTPIALVSI